MAGDWTVWRVARRGLRGVRSRARRLRGPSKHDLAARVAAELDRLTASGAHAEAVALAEACFAEHGSQLVFLRQVRRSAAKAGALTLHLRASRAQQREQPGAAIEAATARLEGQWRETSPDWTPTVAPEVTAGLCPVTAPVPGRALHVLKISLPHRQSGYSVRTLYTLTSQQRSGMDPVAVTALDFPAGLGVGEVDPVESVAGVRHRRLLRASVPEGQPLDGYLDDWATALAPVVAQERPEVIHVHSGHRGYEAALVAFAVGDLLEVPVVYEVRGFFESLWSSDLAWAERSEVYARRRDTETRCMRRAAAVVTLSESMRQEVVSRGVEPAAVHVVPNGVDTDVFAPRSRSAELSSRLGLDGRFVFGYVSNLDHYREGQELLVDAAVELRRRGLPATALVVGDGRRRELLEARARELDAGDAVVFTGRVGHDEVLDYYAQYDVFVVPRVDERAARLVTPLKPFEAMAVGLPLLVSDLPALTEITGEGTRGLSFRAGAADSLVEALVRLYEDPDLRRRLAEAGRDWVVAERQWLGNAERYRTVYRSVLAAAG